LLRVSQPGLNNPSGQEHVVQNSAVIVDVVRTATGRGKPGGALSAVHPADLLARVLRSLVERNNLDPALVDDVIVGCVAQARDQALNIARTSVLAAGFPEEVPATTIDRQCGSSQQAAHFAAQGVLAGAYEIAIAAGVESMSRVPMFGAAEGGHPFAPLTTRYPEGLVSQGVGAELMAAKWELSREELDVFSMRSHERAAETTVAHAFSAEVIPIRLPDGSVHDIDETIRPMTSVEGLASLRPAFKNPQLSQRFPEIDWCITAGNSSPFSDGASACLVMSEAKALELDLRPRARFHSFAVVGSDPIVMLSGVIPATKKALAVGKLNIDDIDCFEVNEAFASVPLAWARALNVDLARINPRGGAIALGHPLGASGTKLLATLLNQLEASTGRFGLLTMCEGGGMANATIIERL
jgi:acetyl-CoA acyltransferase